MSSNTPNHASTLQAVPPVGPLPAQPRGDTGTAGTVRRGNQRGLGGRLIAHFVLIVICLAALLPFLWMLSTSLKTLEATTAFPPTFWPSPIQWHNYADVFHQEKANFLLWTRNTLVIAVLGVTGTTLSSAIVAYGFARLRFRGRKARSSC